MNTMDLMIVAVVGLSCLFGLWRGFVREVLSLLVWIAALFIGGIYGAHLAGVFEPMIENATARFALGFFVLALATLLLGGLINHFLVKLVQLAGLSFSDRLLGAIFGVARGAVVVTIAVFLLSTAYAAEPWWQQSQLVPWFMQLAEWFQVLLDDVAGNGQPAVDLQPEDS